MNEERFRPAWRSYYLHITAMLGCLLLVSLLSAKADLSPFYQKGIWIFFVLFIIVALADMAYRRFRLVLIVKPDEIAMEEGLIARHSVEISTQSIRTIQVRQRIIQRMLNVGDILVASSGTDEYEIRISNMPAPQSIRDKMQVHERSIKDNEGNKEEKTSKID